MGSKGRPFTVGTPPGVPPGVPPGESPMGSAGISGYGGGMISNEEIENNVELVIYGIVTLYERYPKRAVQVGDSKDTK
jgi:hypothetical protein